MTLSPEQLAISRNTSPPLTSISTKPTQDAQQPVLKKYNHEVARLLLDLLDHLEDHGSNGFWPFIDNKTFKRKKLYETLRWVQDHDVDANNKDAVLNVIRDICKIKRSFFGIFASNSLTFFNKLLGERQTEFGQCIFKTNYTKKQLMQNSISSLLYEININPLATRNKYLSSTTYNEEQELIRQREEQELIRQREEQELRRLSEEQELRRLREELNKRRETQSTMRGLNQFFENSDTIERERQRADEERRQRELADSNRGGM